MSNHMQIFAREKGAVAGIVLTAGFGAFARWGSGTIYSAAKAQDLLQALANSALYLGTAIATSSATTLALMLTLVGLVKRLDADFDQDIYERISLISRLSAINLIGAILMLMLLSMPVGSFEEIPDRWYSTLYDFEFGLMVTLCALTVGIILLLMRTVENLIANITPTDEV